MRDLGLELRFGSRRPCKGRSVGEEAPFSIGPDCCGTRRVSSKFGSKTLRDARRRVPSLSFTSPWLGRTIFSGLFGRESSP